MAPAGLDMETRAGGGISLTYGYVENGTGRVSTSAKHNELHVCEKILKKKNTHCNRMKKKKKTQTLYIS